MRFDHLTQVATITAREVVEEAQIVIGTTRTVIVKIKGDKILMLEIPDATSLEWTNVLARIDLRWPGSRL